MLLTIGSADSIRLPPPNWFDGVSWSAVPSGVSGDLTPVEAPKTWPRLLGGSSKLAKLAEERRRKAASSSTQAAPEGALNSLDRLSKPKDVKENQSPPIKLEPKKYPIRKKRELMPPPKEPSPPPEEPKEELPDLRASPTSFGQALSSSLQQQIAPSAIGLKDVLGSPLPEDPFKKPSPDDVVMRAQGSSKGLGR